MTVEVDSLVVRYGDRVAVDGVSFSVAAGEVVALLGPNGAGKTSTVEAVVGLRRFAGGAVSVLGSPVGAVLDRIGVMLQEGGVYPGLRVGEAVRLFASYYPSPASPEALLSRLGLSGLARSTWRTLSGGEQQRLSLALALVGQPAVAFLDEPTAGVDVAGRVVVRSVIRDLAASGAAVLLTTHELDEASRLADRVVIVDRGRVVAAGTPAELMASGGGSEIRFGAPPGLDVASLGTAVGGPVVESSPGEYVVGVSPTPAAVAAVTAWLAARDLPLADLRAGRSSLEDVFLRLTQP